MNFKFPFTVLFFFLFSLSFSQTGIISGKILDVTNNEPIPFANVVIQETTIGATTDIDGIFKITDLEPGLYNVNVSFLGYESQTVYEIEVYNNRPASIQVSLEPSSTEIGEIEVIAAPFRKQLESPVSVRTIGVNEIARYPGGNRDISKVIQSLPGVGSTVSFRNDILIRGGSPSENRFYLDGIEIPTINHFSTQGASGGPVGMINVDFIRSVDFYTGAFPSNRGNSLSSVMELSLIDGRDDRPGATFTVGASEVAAAFETPLKDKGTLIFAVRRSYLQLLFKAFQLPFLPTYNDLQFKTKLKLNDRNELTILGLAAYDENNLNLGANETPDQQYILGNLPEQIQWNYTWGIRHKLFKDKSYWTFVLSQSMLSNRAFKYANNDDSTEDNLLIDYNSTEQENKIRVENTGRINGWKYNIGFNYELARATTDRFIRTFVPNVGPFEFNTDAKLFINKYGLFGQLSKRFFKEKLSTSIGFRFDGADINNWASNPLRQFSPRLSLSYAVTDKVNINFNTGIYYQLPTYTLLSYKENDEFLNVDRLDYINNKQVVLGIEYITEKNSLFSVEGFLKLYDNYPLLLSDSISFANEGGGFGVVGLDPANSDSKGRAYGLEFLFQQKLFKNWYGIVSYTLFWSEFTNGAGEYRPSAWDARNIFSFTGGRKFNKNWEIGLRFGVSGGLPYTPFDIPQSILIENYERTGAGIPDYTFLNSERTNWSHQLDVRIDKKWFFKKWSLNLYLDIQNAYNFEAQLPPYLNVERTEAGEPIANPDGTYTPVLVDDRAGQLLPSIGIVVKL